MILSLQIEDEEAAAKGQQELGNVQQATSSTELMLDGCPDIGSSDHPTDVAHVLTLTPAPETKAYLDRSRPTSYELTLVSSTSTNLTGRQSWESPSKPSDLAVRLIDLDSESSSDCLDGPNSVVPQTLRGRVSVDGAAVAQHSLGSSSIPSQVTSHVNSLL